MRECVEFLQFDGADPIEHFYVWQEECVLFSTREKNLSRFLRVESSFQKVRNFEKSTTEKCRIICTTYESFVERRMQLAFYDGAAQKMHL